MTAATILFTGCALLCALGCAAALVFCLRSVAQCADSERSLDRHAARLMTAEHEIAVLNGQLHKLRQKIYSMKSEIPAIEIAAPVSMQVCENWTLAQNEGPGSRAALCECAYCTERRAGREALRSRFVPKTAKGK